MIDAAQATAHVFPLAALSLFAENSHQGHHAPDSTFRPGATLAISSTATGLPGCLYDSGTWSRCTSKERDAETGLDYFGARYISNAQGRFTSPDEPLTDQSPGDPQSWNLYGYVRNNPLKFTDPSGRDCAYTSNQTNEYITVRVETGNCSQGGGTFVNGTIDTNALTYNGKSLDIGYSDRNGAAGVFSKNLGAPVYDFPGIEGPANRAGAERIVRDAGPWVYAAGEGLRGFAYLVAPPAMALADCAAAGKGCSPTSVAVAMVPGGDEELTAARIIAKSRAGSVLREFPGQYLNSTLPEIRRDAKAGIQAARKALKLLNDNREKFTKGLP